MADASLSYRIVKFLEGYKSWINGGEIERRAMNLGYKGSTASRIARKLAEEGVLLRKEEGGSVWYQFNQNKVI